MPNKITNLNPIYTKDHQRAYIVNRRKAKLLKIASIINFIVISLLAIFLLSLITVSSATIPLVHVAIGVITPIIGILFSSFLKGYKRCDISALFYKNVVDQINILKNQDLKETKKYLNIIKCSPPNIENSIPAIANFKVLEIKKNSSLDEIEKLKKNITTNLTLEYTVQKQIHNIQENDILKTKLRLAEIFHLIENPTSKKSLQNFGKIITLSYAKRHASKESNDDVYFIFKDNIQKQKNRKCLTSMEINDLEIRDISKIIFKD